MTRSLPRPGSDRRHAAPRTPRGSTRLTSNTVLFLATNAAAADRLEFDREARAIQMELERSGSRDSFEFVTRSAVEPLDLLREIRRLKPTVVHFSGCGRPLVLRDEPRQRPGRCTVGELANPHGSERFGIFFRAPDGHAKLVSSAALAETLSAAGTSVKLVVLNVRHSEVQTEALLAHVDCVIEMGSSIADDAARSFMIGFYGGLGERESIAAAYKQGRVAIRLEGLQAAHHPQLRARPGVDADRLVLATG